MNLWNESFAFDVAHLSRRYNVDSTQVTWAINADGPGSRRALRRTNTSNGISPGYLTFAPSRRQGGVWTPQTGLVVGMLVKVTDLARISSGLLLEVTGFSTIGALGIFRFAINSDGTMTAGRYVFPGYTNQVTTAALFTNAQWTFIEMELTIDGSAGIIGISQDGVDIVTSTGLNTTPFRTGVVYTNTWSSLNLLRMTSQVSPYLDVRMLDLYIFDKAGARNIARAGVHEIRRSLVVSAGGFDGWTPNTGTNHAAVADMPEDDATTTVAASVAGTRDEWTFDTVEPGVDPPALMLTLVAQRTGPGAAAVTPSLLGVDEAVGIGVPSTDFRHLSFPYDTNPATTDPFESAELAAPVAGALKSL